jgi:hypothetical protein
MATINATFAALCSGVDASYISDILAPTGTNLTDAQLNLRINQAYFYTEPLIGELSDCGGNDAYCEIAALVAAHMVTVSERQTKSEDVAGEWRVAYMGKEGFALRASLYGQQAEAMDCSGYLAEIAGGGVKRASFDVISRRDIEDINQKIEIDYQ